jgi:hypothetical protein
MDLERIGQFRGFNIAANVIAALARRKMGRVKFARDTRPMNAMNFRTLLAFARNLSFIDNRSRPA